MGNITSSNTGHISQRQQENGKQWSNSFPRTPTTQLHHHKVLPERDIRQKLRPTNNGEILHSGGTLSGRHQVKPTSEAYQNGYKEDRPQSPRTYMPNKHGYKRASNYESKNYYNRMHHQEYKEQVKRFASEPDLHDPYYKEPQDSRDKWKAKKKYRAPAPPRIENYSEWDDDGRISSPIRRARLFKTRAEMKKRNSSQLDTAREVGLKRQTSEPNEEEPVRLREHYKPKAPTNRLSLPELRRANSMPEFQQELKQATERLRNSKLLERDSPQSDKEKLKTLDITKKESMKSKIKQIAEKDEKLTKTLDVRSPGAGQESPVCQTKKEPPAKMFYFGMDAPIEVSTIKVNPETDVDHFTSVLPQHRCYGPMANSSDSDLSSELEMDERTDTNGIDLRLRPILPKKQLEIPRFSPAAAWRMLSSIESNTATSTVASDEGPVFIEDKIEKLSRQPPPPTIPVGHRSSHDKSGDSGISGDAGPAVYDEGPDGLPLKPKSNGQLTGKPRATHWTPQQDLGDESSVEEGPASDADVGDKFAAKPHVFSLSLPRENLLSSYISDKLHSYTSLQKLKQTASTPPPKKEPPQKQSENWFLSRSAPNSVNTGFSSLELQRPQKSEEVQPTMVPKKSGRVMYLPEFKSGSSKTRSRSNDNHFKAMFQSKSCENISYSRRSTSEPEDMQDPQPRQESEKRVERKPKKFTFQSTVRQIERKRLAEKLSREAERKEKQRLRELEAMQRVEEEFQRKRAREKASIRQQLRLFSMEDSGWSSLPPDINMKENIISARSEPDGAVSSSTSSPSLPNVPVPKAFQKRNSTGKYATSSDSGSEQNRVQAPVTQILSEYRQPQREYKDYRGSRYLMEHSEPYLRQTTVHPQVTCNMPKAHQGSPQDNGLNYRKNFAHGVKSPGSSYSEESNRNHSPSLYQRPHTPVTRF